MFFCDHFDTRHTVDRAPVQTGKISLMDRATQYSTRI